MRILVADDHPIVRVGVSHILAKAFKGVTVEEACNARQVLQQLGTGRWDLLLLDMTMPGRAGLDLIKQVKEQKPKLPVLVLSIHSESDYGIRALKAGASGYLTKEAIPEHLIAAIKKVMKGGIYVTDSLAEKLAVALRHKFDLLPHETLTDREYEVLQFIASGLTTGEIARKLSLSVKTISTFRAHVMQKMALKNNAAIIRYGIKHRLTE